MTKISSTTAKTLYAFTWWTLRDYLVSDRATPTEIKVNWRQYPRAWLVNSYNDFMLSFIIKIKIKLGPRCFCKGDSPFRASLGELWSAPPPSWSALATIHVLNELVAPAPLDSVNNALTVVGSLPEAEQRWLCGQSRSGKKRRRSKAYEGALPKKLLVSVGSSNLDNVSGCL
jgi:hypothetical protein